MGFRNQIIGLIRFSYPATEGFAVSRRSEEELEALLYDPVRLDRRFAYLETITLPSLAAQTDADFTCVILGGATLLPRYKGRLRDLAEKYAFLKPVFLERMGPLPSAKRSFRRALEEGSTHVTGFRLDDDDALAVDYIARTRDMADRLIGAGMAEGPTALGFSHALYWNLNDPKQPFHEFRESQPAGQACAMITTSELETCIYRYNHRKLACHIPTLLTPGDAPMFLRTLHGHNDSDRRIPPHAVAMPEKRGRRLMAERFGLDPDAAMTLMGAI